MIKKDKTGKIKETLVNRKKLHEKAWTVFSKWIRKRDRECITCGAAFWDEALGEWGIVGLEAGHFHHNVLDFDEININAQCKKCNRYLSGNASKYSVYLVEKYGQDEFLALANRAKLALRGSRLSVQEYLDLIAKYSE